MAITRVACFAILAACGRIAFDPIPDGGADGAAPAGLLIYFTFDVDVQHDDSPAHHDAQCPPNAGCPGQVVGRVSLAASFQGGQCLTIPDAADLRPARFTFAEWFMTIQ